MQRIIDLMIQNSRVHLMSSSEISRLMNCYGVNSMLGVYVHNRHSLGINVSPDDPKYMMVVFHELVHATSKWLRPVFGMFGNRSDFVKEELVAEIGSHKLLEHFGLLTEDYEASIHVRTQGYIKELSLHYHEYIEQAYKEANEAFELVLKWSQDQSNVVTTAA